MRRERICTTFSISFLLPITGSSLPSRARCVRRRKFDYTPNTKRVIQYAEEFAFQDDSVSVKQVGTEHMLLAVIATEYTGVGIR